MSNNTVTQATPIKSRLSDIETKSGKPRLRTGIPADTPHSIDVSPVRYAVAPLAWCGPQANPGHHPARDPGPCPVRPIGLRVDGFFFFDGFGQMRKISAWALGRRVQILALFGGDIGAEWLRRRFPRYDRDGVWTAGFNVRDCGSWLIGECGRKGILGILGRADLPSALAVCGLTRPLVKFR
jgi:hypothetical protein